MDQLSRKPAKAPSQNAPQQDIGTSKSFVLFGVKIISPVTTAQGYTSLPLNYRPLLEFGKFYKCKVK